MSKSAARRGRGPAGSMRGSYPKSSFCVGVGPDALEIELLVEHLARLKASSGIDVPIYDFKTHRRRPESRRVEPARVVLVEGILVFVDPRVREHLDMKIF